MEEQTAKVFNTEGVSIYTGQLLISRQEASTKLYDC